MADLREKGRLVEVTRHVEPVHEMAAYSAAVGSRPILFQNVGRAKFPVLFNLFGDVEWLANWTGIPQDGMLRAFFQSCDRPVPPLVAASRHDVVVQSSLDLTEWLPIGQDYPAQRVPCINPGVVFVRDPETGLINSSMHSLNLIEPNRLVVHVRALHFGHIYGKWQRLGKPMPVAVAIGLDPALWLGLGLSIDHPPTEIEVAGGLTSPVPMTACSAVDLEVPAAAEVVLEGFVHPGIRGPGGPEPLPYHLYSQPYNGPVIDVHRLTAFSDAVVHGMLNGSPDHLNTLAWLKEFEALRHLRGAGLAAGVRAIKCDPNGEDWNYCAISVDRAHAKDAREIIESLMNAKLRLGGLRRVVVVDDDIDVGNRRQLDWAIATRVQPARDVLIFQEARISSPDPMAQGGSLSKIGYDATIPPGKEREHARNELAWTGEVDVPGSWPELPERPGQTLAI